MKINDGAVVDKPGSSLNNKTGLWKTKIPTINHKKCQKCGICWMYCPENAIKMKKKVEIDYQHCKGCGICANVCPFKAIEMVEVEK